MTGKFESLRVEYQDVLRKSFQSNSIESIENKVKQVTKTAADIKSPLDQAFRDILLELLEKEVPVETLRLLVDCSVSTCRKELSNPTMPVVLLSDIFDALTLDTCQEMFLYVENNVEVWKEPLFFSCCKNNLLRLCNDLLRRLSRSTATVFCGRILLFLAKFFPFSERSGLNIVSEFNLENVTEYGADSAQDPAADLDTSDSKKNGVIDFTFYCKFWSLQDFFRDPNQLYSKVQWKLFCSHASSVLSTFQGLKLEHVEHNGVYNEDMKDKMYFSKYLTSQKLLDLQLYDVNFRRAVLLQFLILFQYLSSSVKFKSDSYELKTDQKEWIQASTDKVLQLLRETPPDGRRFAEIASSILSREEYWNAWKNDGCPELKKNQIPLDTSETRPKNSSQPLLGDLIKEATGQGKYYMGSAELTRLWNLCPDNLEACKGKERNFLPTLEDYFSDAVAQIESNTTIKDEENLLKDGNYGWRALRLLAKRSPHFFTYSNIIMNPLSSYLQMMVKKIANERLRKEENSQESQSNDADEEMLFKDTQVDETIKEDDIKQEDFLDDKNARVEHKINTNLVQVFSEKVAPNWKKLAVKLGYKPDEVQFFAQEHTTEVEQARHMLKLWFEEDEDATLDNFLYILEGLELSEAAEVVRNEINSMDG